jgi:DNA polymerase-1
MDDEGLSNVRLHLIEGRDDVSRFYDWLDEGPLTHGIMAVDTESTGLWWREGERTRLVQIGDTEQGWAIPWDRWSGLFEDAVEQFKGTMFMHNALFDLPFLRHMGVTLDHTRVGDTMIMCQILEPHKSAGLKPASSRHIDPAAGAAQKELEEAIRKLGWEGVPIKFGPYWQYAALDPVLTARLARKLLPLIEKYGATAAYDVENAVMWVLDRMMMKGVAVDIAQAQHYMDKFREYCDQAKQWCEREYGVSPGSNAKVVEKLQEFGYTFDQFTAAGGVKLDKEVLGDIDHPLAQTVLKRRQYDKLASTYLKYYIEHNHDGRIHPQIRSMGARTGRMSMANPNFQNLPRVAEANRAASAIRDCIVPSAGNVQIFCDFSQIETRLLAHLSRDPGLIAAFHQPEDFFVTLARQVFSDSTIGKKDVRRNAIKTWVYAKIYGAGMEKLARTLNMDFAAMQQFDRSISDKFPGIRQFQNEVQATARANFADSGEPFITCPLSGRRHVADRGKEYALVNYLIQGMAAFFFKTKLLELDAAGLGDYMILPVHDEIILDCPVEKAPWVVEILTSVMNDATTFSVPIQAEVSFGYRWGSKMDWSEWEKVEC